MAIRVIRHGTKVFRTTCPVCGCEFEYEYEDLQTLYGIAKQVKCPDCGEWLDHREVYPRQPEPYPPLNPLNPNVIWTSPNTNDLVYDCNRCPNKPNPDKPVVGDSPCTWCPKMQPYCTTSTADLKIDPNLYKNTTTSYADLKVNTESNDTNTNYTTDLVK